MIDVGATRPGLGVCTTGHGPDVYTTRSRLFDWTIWSRLGVWATGHGLDVGIIWCELGVGANGYRLDVEATGYGLGVGATGHALGPVRDFHSQDGWTS